MIERYCQRCAHRATYKTEALADHHFSRHSCEKRLKAAARHAAYVRRLNAVDTTPKPCLHKRANHQHGTRACYVLDKCRCRPCRDATAAAEAERVRLKAYGRYDKYVDAEPIRAHLKELAAYGIGLKRVARLTGVSTGVLSKIVFGTYERVEGPQRGRYGRGELVRGPSMRVTRANAEKILGVKAVPANLGSVQPDHERTPIARQHLQALVALGWSQQRLGNRLGVLRSNMQPLMADRVMTRRMVDRIEALYAELSMTPPPEHDQRTKIAASRSRNYAKARGWLPPLALELVEPIEDETNPDLDEQAIFRRMSGDRSVRLNRHERREVVARLRDRGLSYNQIERLTGVDGRQITRDLKAAS